MAYRGSGWGRVDRPVFLQAILILVIVLLDAPEKVNGAIPDSTRTVSIAEVLSDHNRDNKPDFLGERFTISGRATVSSSVFDDHNLMVYVQDKSAGILVFTDTWKKPVRAGDSLIVTGTLQLYSGTPEIVVDSYQIVKSKSRIPSPLSLDLAFRDPERYPGMLVRGRAVVVRNDFETNATMVRIAPSDSSGHFLYVFVSRANTFYQNFDLSVLSIGDHITVEGILDKHYSRHADRLLYEVLPRTPDDIGYAGIPRQYRNIALWIGGVFILAIAGWIVSLKKQVRSQTDVIAQALKEKETLLQEIHHRVKNNLSVISGLLELQKYEPVDSVEALIEDTQFRIQSIGMIHEKLYQTDTLSDIDVQEYIEDFTDVLVETFNSSHKKIKISKSLQSFRLELTKAVPLGLVVNELLSNAFKHGFANVNEGEIKINLIETKGDAVLSVADNGRGLPDGFTLNQSGSLGCMLITTLTDQLNGTVNVSQDDWTEFTVTFPING